MEALIDSLFSKPQADAIRKLWVDKDSRLLIEKEIGKQMFENHELLTQLPLTQLMFMMSLANFSSSQEECYDVASIVYWGIGTTDIIPLVSEHNNKELAYRCLITLGLFKKAMIRRQNRFAAPSVTFYRRAGINSFRLIGMVDISKHFCLWEQYLGEMFVV